MGVAELRDAINKKYGTDIMFSPAESLGIQDMPRFSSGSLSIDVDTGGGWPEGKIIEIFGPESSGKTFLLNKAIATVTNREKNNKVLLIDEEGSFDKDWVTRCGVCLKNLEVVRSSYAEQALDIMEVATQSGEFGIVALDSIAALIPKKELEDSTEDWQMGLLARLMGKACRKAYRALNESERKGSRTTVFFINQLRLKIGVVFGNPETTPGGMAMKFAASVRMDIRKRDMLKDAFDRVDRQLSSYTVVKNKTAPPLRKGDILYYLDGPNMAKFENIDALIGMGLQTGKLQQTGAWIGGEWLGGTKFQGRGKLGEHFSTLSTDELNVMLGDVSAHYLSGNPLSFRF